MARQTYLFGDTRNDVIADDLASAELRVLTWNVQSSSPERAHKQFDWLVGTKANVLALTELKSGKGADHLASSLEGCGFQVFFSEPVGGGHGTLIAVKGLGARRWDLGVSVLPARVTALKVDTFMGELALVAVYAPSRSPGESAAATERRMAFQRSFTRSLALGRRESGARHCLVVGDLNVVERNHEPPHDLFGEPDYRFYEGFREVGLTDGYRAFAPTAIEHSWVGPTGSKQRIDHAFLSETVLQKTVACSYDHEPRETRLSDHSALVVHIRR